MQKSCFALIVQAATRGNFKGFLETPHVLIQVLSTTGFPSVSWILQPRDWNQTFHLIPAGLWIHRNEELRWWASSFLLFPRNKAEEVKKCSKHKKLCPAQEEQRPTCDCTKKGTLLCLQQSSWAAEPIWKMWNFCSLSRFWHLQQLSSTGYSLPNSSELGAAFSQHKNYTGVFRRCINCRNSLLKSFVKYLLLKK